MISRVTVALLVLTSVVLGTTAPAAGQDGEPYFLRRDLTILSEQLALEETQKTIIEVILLEYQTEHDLLREAIREEVFAMQPARDEAEQEEFDALQAERKAMFAELKEVSETLRQLREGDAAGELSQDVVDSVERRYDAIRSEITELSPPTPEMGNMQDMFRQIGEISRQSRDKGAALDAAFVADVKNILNDEQVQRWPLVEMKLRRIKTLGRGRLSGESIDLLILLREVGASPDAMAELSQILSAYEVALDQALIARNAAVKEAERGMGDAMRERDFETAATIMRDSTAYRKVVRDVNDTYRDVILDAFGDSELSASFAQAYRERAFERVYRATRTERLFESVLNMELDAERHAAVVELQALYLQELGVRNQQIEQIVHREEPAQQTGWLTRWQARSNGGEAPADPVREAFDARTEMDETYRTRLEALLTPEQVAAFPEPERRGWGRGGGRRGWMGGGAAGEAAREAMRSQMMERYDLDGDGEIGAEERQILREEMRRMWGGRGGRDG